MVDAPQIARELADDASTIRRLRAGALTLTYRENGLAGGPALVLLHGIGSGSASWSVQLYALAERGLRVMAWDAPGYGGSDALPLESPLAVDYAVALVDFVDALGLERLYLIGHSLGALVAASYCRIAGASRVERLILASPATGYGKAPELLRRDKIDGRLAEMGRLGPAGVAERRGPGLLSPNAPAEAVAHARAVMRQLRPDGYAQAVRMLGQGDIFADAPAITVPTLVLCGSADTVTPEEGCQRIAAAIAGARYRTLPGLGHLAHVEDPTRFAEAVLSFLYPVDTK